MGFLLWRRNLTASLYLAACQVYSQIFIRKCWKDTVSLEKKKIILKSKGFLRWYITSYINHSLNNNQNSASLKTSSKTCSETSAITKSRSSSARWVSMKPYFILLFLPTLKNSCYSLFFLKENLKIVWALEFFSLQKIFKSNKSKFNKNSIVSFRAG